MGPLPGSASLIPDCLLPTASDQFWDVGEGSVKLLGILPTALTKLGPAASSPTGHLGNLLGNLAGIEAARGEIRGHRDEEGGLVLNDCSEGNHGAAKLLPEPVGHPAEIVGLLGFDPGRQQLEAVDRLRLFQQSFQDGLGRAPPEARQLPPLFARLGKQGTDPIGQPVRRGR